MTPLDDGPDGRPAAIDCETAVRRLWDYIDGRLPHIARAEVEEHLNTCELCSPHFDFARTMRSELAASAPSAVSDDEEARLLERVRSALRSLRTDDDPTTH